jgi:hypothetical protein
MVEHYKNIGQVAIAAVTYENTGTNWVAVVGADLNPVQTIAANQSIVVLQTVDAQENIVDTARIIGDNYVAAPASGGTVVVIQLVHKMLIPPGGSLESPGANTGSVLLIEALDTSAVDGRNSLENALLIST